MHYRTKRIFVQAVQHSLGVFGMRLTRADSRIGMRTCLQVLSNQGFAPASVLDVGAAAGRWTELALQFWPETQYLLIEPLPERLPELAILRAKYPNVRFVNAAAGAPPGELPFYVATNLYSGNLLAIGKYVRQVPIVTIDGLVAAGELQQPELMKLDVQGYELRVLEGAASTMNRCDYILLEVSLIRWSPSVPLFHETIAWMADHRFRPIEIVDVLRRPPHGVMESCDVLFTR